MSSALAPRTGVGLSNSWSIPILVRQRRGVQLVADGSPARQQLIHERDKSIRMASLEEMYQLMNYDVFQALRWLFDQLQIQPNSLSLNGTGSPPCFHPHNVPCRRWNLQVLCPLFD